MEIKGDKLEIYNGPVDRVGGAGPEPEERPAQRTIATDVPVNTLHLTEEEKAGGTSFKKLHQEKAKQIATQDGSIVANMTAGELADSLATTCRFCHWWNREKLARSLDRMAAEKTPENLTKLNELRSKFVEAGLSGINEIDAAIKQDMGECAALTELWQDTILTHALARCPSAMPNGQPLPSCFKPRNMQARRDAAAARDHILRAAARPTK